MSKKGTEIIKPKSTSIASVEYDHETSILTVEYKGKGGAPNRVYPYSGVPVAKWEQLRNAVSVGSFIQTNIVGKFPEAVADDDARRGRQAEKLLAEFFDHIQGVDAATVRRDLIPQTTSAFDKEWLPKVKELLGR